MKKRSPKVYLRQLQIMQHQGTHLKEMDFLQEEEHVCLNCRTMFTGNYCPNCGQKADTRRLTFRDAFDMLLSLFTNLDHGFLHTCADLCYRPGHMIRDYLKGHRVEYVHPIKLIFILGTIYLAVEYLFYQEWQFQEGERSSVIKDNHPVIAAFLEPVQAYMEQPPVLALMLILFLMVPNRFFFRKSPFGQTMNLAEHFYAMVFVGCQIFMLSILSTPINVLVYEDFIEVEMWALLLIVWDFYQLMGFRFWKTLRQCLKSAIVGFLFFLLFLALLIGLGLLVYYLVTGSLEIRNVHI